MNLLKVESSENTLFFWNKIALIAAIICWEYNDFIT